MTQPTRERVLRLCRMLIVTGLAGLFFTAEIHAQEADLSAAITKPDVEAAPPPEERAAEMQGLDDPEIPLNELTLRLIPLTADELGELAADWLTIVRASTVQVVDEQIRINRTEASSIEEAARKRLTEASDNRRALFDKYSAVLNAWELKGGDAAKIAGYRTYRSSIIVEETRNTDWRTLLAQAWSWTLSRDGGGKVATNVGIILGSFLGLVLLARIVRRGVRFWMGRIPNFSKLLVGFIALMSYWVTLAVGLMLVLAALGVNITPLFALVGGASFILAFAMQETLGNLAAGMMIMVNHPFDEGDIVDIGGVSGAVRKVSLVSTTVVTPDNQVVVVPNRSVWGNVITNSTASETRRVDLVFGVSYDTPIARAQEELEKTVRAHPLVLTEPAPVIHVHALTEKGVEFIVRPWTQSDDYWTVYWDLTRDVKDALDRAGMEEVEAGAPPVVSADPKPVDLESAEPATA